MYFKYVFCFHMSLQKPKLKMRESQFYGCYERVRNIKFSLPSYYAYKVPYTCLNT